MVRYVLHQAGYRDVSITAPHKVLTADYLAGQLSVHNPLLTRTYRALGEAVPAAVRQRPIRIDSGEFTAFAWRPA